MGTRTQGMHDLTEHLASSTIYFHYPSLLKFVVKSNIRRATALAALQFDDTLRVINIIICRRENVINIYNCKSIPSFPS